MKKMKWFVAFMAVVLVAAASAGDFAPIPTTRPNLDIMKCAHRGVKYYAPENTIPAIEKAIELGYTYVEIDVRYTKDGVPVLMHDSSVTRTTSGVGPLSWYTLSELKKLDAGFWKGPEFIGTKVPTVEEALQVMEGRIKLYLDQKEPPTPGLIELFKEYNFYPDNIVVVGGGPRQKKFLEYEPHAPVMPKMHSTEDVDRLIEEFPSLVAFNSDCSEITHEMVDAAHARGRMVFTNVLHMPLWVMDDCMRKPMLAGSDVIQFDKVPLFEKTMNDLKTGAE